MQNNYYNQIKDILIDNVVYKKVKDYSKNRNDLESYLSIGKLLIEAQVSEERAKYWDGLIKEFSKRLKIDLNKKFKSRVLWRARKFYLLCNNKMLTVSTQLTWSHYIELYR